MAAVESAARCETVCYQNRGGEDVVAAMRDVVVRLCQRRSWKRSVSRGC